MDVCCCLSCFYCCFLQYTVYYCCLVFSLLVLAVDASDVALCLSLCLVMFLCSFGVENLQLSFSPGTWVMVKWVPQIARGLRNHKARKSETGHLGVLYRDF